MIFKLVLAAYVYNLYINKDMSTILTVKYKDTEIYITAEPEKTVRWVKEQIQAQTKIPVIQQELSYKDGQTKIVLTDNQKNLKFIKITDSVLTLKNLGKQIRWEHVFYIEYLGPIIIFPLFYLFGKKELYTPIQTIALGMAVLHYLKRQYETAYVHVFSRESMPFKRVLINSIHYWVFFGLFNAIELYFFPSKQTHSNTVIIVLVALWVIFEILNYKCHKVLGDFRRTPKQKSGKEYQNATKVRQIPYGYGFDSVSCANYFWESLGWVAFSILTGSYTAYFFTVLSALQMAQWAKDKHTRYLKEFKDAYPKGRKAMFPFIF